jgi:hypothetical protein
MQCSKCGLDLPEGAKFCPSCGTEIVAAEEKPAAPPSPPPQPAPVTPTAPAAPAPVVDPFLKKWNWGAFLLSWIWAFGHGQILIGILILVLGLIPVIGTLVDLGLVIYLGIKGNELAWNSGKFTSIEQLKETERVWAKWAVIIFIISIVLFILITIIGVVAAVMSSLQTTTSEFMLFL